MHERKGLFRCQLVPQVFQTEGGSGVSFGPEDCHHLTKNTDWTLLTSLTQHVSHHMPEP